MSNRNRRTQRDTDIRILDLLTKEELAGLAILMDMPASEHQRHLCETCDCFGCAVVGRHLGPLIVGLSIGTPDLAEEIQILRANPRLLAERRRQTDAFLSRKRGPKPSMGSN